MPITQEEIERRIAAAREQGWDDARIQKAVQQTVQKSGGLAEPQPQKAQEQPKERSFLRSLAPTGGAILGGIAGAPLGPLGLIAGGAIGGGLAEEAAQKALGEERDPKKVRSEAILGGVGGAIGPAIKGVTGLVRGGASSAAKFAGQRSAASILSTTPKSIELAQKGGVSLIDDAPKTLPKLFSQAGNNIDDVIGPVSSKGRGGLVRNLMQQQESRISGAIRQVPKGLKMSGDDILVRLKEQRALLSRQVGRGEEIAALDDVIREAQKKYKGGISLKKATSTFREVSREFGAKITETEKGAVGRVARKIEANTLRDAIRNQVPEIADALDQEQLLIIYRDLLNHTRNVWAAKPLSVAPIEMVNQMFRSVPVSKFILNAANASDEAVRAATAGQKAIADFSRIGGKITKDEVQRIVGGQVGARIISPGTTPTAPSEQGIGATSTPDILQSIGVGQPQLVDPQTQQMNSALRMLVVQDLMETGGSRIGHITSAAKILGLSPEGQGKGAGLDLSVEQQRDVAKLVGGQQQVELFAETLQDKFGLPETGLEAFFTGTGQKIGALLRTNEEVRAFGQVRKSLSSLIARAFGEVGVLTDKDREIALQAIPDVGDSLPAVQQKLDILRSVVQRNIQNISALSGAGFEGSPLSGLTGSEQPTQLQGSSF